MSAFEKSSIQYFSALKRLEEVLQIPADDIIRDSAIQRFEFTIELAWKCIKLFLEEKKGIVCLAPKDCLRLAFQHGLIDYDEFWLDMIDMRNMTAHSYDEQISKEIYSELKNALRRFRKLKEALQQK
ncbi:MAG: HI0074 family nucleotidyltransferase substrate-binding subunit [Bacteroidetes bacterium]|nr:HI0074 family nucleotidyltransferase substrate-binding subunit [Bacteroidota bacterium]